MYQWINRPERARRTKSKKNQDKDLELAIASSLGTDLALVVPLSKFHSSPAKGRLWTQGYKIYHRVMGNHVAVWVEKKPGLSL